MIELGLVEKGREKYYPSAVTILAGRRPEIEGRTVPVKLYIILYVLVSLAILVIANIR